MKTIKRILLFILLLICFKSHADKLEKGFEKLKVFDYFAAKEYFEKTLEDEPAAAAYGLSKIYSIEKNPFYNTDLARQYILFSDSVFKKLKEKTKKNYKQFDVTDSSIQFLSHYICNDAFKNAQNINSVEIYNHYIQNFSTCFRISESISLRDSAAFRDAQAENTSNAFKKFISLYPHSSQYPEALNNYEELIFKENTSDNSIESYEHFISNFPENPYCSKAEKMIYTLSVPDKLLPQYIFYVRKYKNTRFSTEAWHEIYKLSVKEFTPQAFDKFKSEFPDYPFPDELTNDFQLQNYFFLPFKEKDKWGFINELGDIMIKPSFEEAALFSDGLAAVSKKGKYGYIDKTGKTIIEYQFQDAEAFNNESAIVKKDTLYGLIDKKGKFLIQPRYQELSEATDDIFMAVKNEKSGYLHKNGKPLTEFVFDLAGDFINGFALVNKNEKYGLINERGNFIIELKFAELNFIENNLLKALSESESWGILNVKGDTILPLVYDDIGEFQNHRALVAKNGKCGYVNEQGELLIPIKYVYSSVMLHTGQFQGGYALLKQKNKSVLIDTTGKVISFSGYEDYSHPSGGFFPIKKKKKWGFADSSGKIKIPCRFELVETFDEGYAIFKQNNLIGLIDTTGKEFIPPLYEDIKVLDQTILVRSKDKYGLLNKGGILLIPCLYDKIEFISSFIAKAIDKKGVTYINLNSGKIIFNSSKN